MPTKKTSGPKKPLDKKTAERLLNLLSTDNAFRRQFKSNPGQALATLGHVDEAAIAGCASVKSIAPKAEFAASMDALKAHVMAYGMFMDPHCYEAGKVATKLRRK